MRELLSRVRLYIQSNKYFVLTIIIIIAVGVGLLFYIRNTGETTTTINDKSTPIALRESQVTLVLIEGTVEVDKEGKGSFASGVVEDRLLPGYSIKTSAVSKAVLRFTTDDILVLDENSEVKIISAGKSEIIVKLIYGRTYNVVEKTDGKTYSITKGEVKITTLGTEFLVEAQKGSENINVFAYKSNVKLESDSIKEEIFEQNRFTFNIKTKNYFGNVMNDAEKEGNKIYLDLIVRAREIIKVQEAAIAAAGQTPNGSATPITANNIGSTGGTGTSGSSGGGSSGTNSSGGGSSDSGSGTNSSNIFGQYSNTSIEDIVNALQLVYNDTIGDWNNPGGGYPPSGVYHYGPVDLDDLYMGVRDGRLYIKWTLGGTIPSSLQTIDSNKITTIVYNVGIDTDGNENTGMFGAETFLQINIQYHDNGQIWYTPWFQAGYISGEGDSAVFEKRGNGLAHTYNSGLGKQTIVYSYALGDLANTVSIGSNLRINVWSEAESNLWHHYSFDGQSNWESWTVTGI
jgi:uncharacterized membrane protein YgcG